MRMNLKSSAAFALGGDVSLHEEGATGAAPQCDPPTGGSSPLSLSPPLCHAGAGRCRAARAMAAQWLSLLSRSATPEESAAPPGGLELVPGAEESVPELLRTLKQIARTGAARENLSHGTAESASTAGESGSHSSASSCSSRAVDAGEGEANKTWEEIRVHFDTVCRLVRNRKELSAVLDTALGGDWCLRRSGAGRDGSEPPPLFAEESSPGVRSTLNHRAPPFEARAPPRPSTPPTAARSMSSSLSSPAVTFNLESREEMMRRRTAAAVQYGMNPTGESYYDARQSNKRNAPISPLHTFMNLSTSRGYCPFDYLLVLDFEATCEEVTPPSYLHEIIEFPVVVVDVKLQRKVAEFHRFVKPKVQPKLSDFCHRLTGIRQEDVDNAPLLEDVIKQFERWYANTIPNGSRTMFATDGSADLREFMYTHSVLRQGIRFPSMFYQWIDVKRSFAHYFQCQQGKIKAMLDALHCPLEGRLHSGLDDARNVATIVTRMLQLGYSFCEIPLSRLTYATPAASSVGNFLPSPMTAINGTAPDDVTARRDAPGTG